MLTSRYRHNGQAAGRQRDHRRAMPDHVDYAAALAAFFITAAPFARQRFSRFLLC